MAPLEIQKNSEILRWKGYFFFLKKNKDHFGKFFKSRNYLLQFFLVTTASMNKYAQMTIN